MVWNIILSFFDTEGLDLGYINLFQLGGLLRHVIGYLLQLVDEVNLVHVELFLGVVEDLQHVFEPTLILFDVVL